MKNSERTRTFTTFFEGCWSPANEVFPIETPDGFLVGGFTIIEGPVWKCFVAARGYMESLYLEPGKLWITPDVSQRGTEKLILSASKINEYSKEVNLEEEA